jgi:hypothetical protein
VRRPKTPSAALWIACAGCLVSIDAEPDIQSVELVGIAPGERLGAGAQVQVRIEGVELWNRTATVEVHRIDESGTDQIEASFAAVFDDEQDRQVATGTWTVQGDFLAVKGSSEIYLVVSFKSESERSSSFMVVADPKLVSIDLVGLSAGQRVEAGAAIQVELVGAEVAGLPVLLEIRRTGEEIVGTATVSFDTSSDAQAASWEWRVEGPFLERPGRNDLWVRAVLGDQALISERVFVEVITAVTGVNVLVDGAAAEWNQPIRFPAPVSVEVLGTGLLDQPLVIDFFRAAPEFVLTTFDRIADSNRFLLTFTPDPAIFVNGELRVPIYFRAVAGGVEGNSPTVSLELTGIARCAWFRNGQELADEAQVADRTDVELRTFTWGLDGSSANFDIFENDDVGDDYQTSLDGTVASDSVSPVWTAVFVQDNITDIQSEFFFDVRIEDRSCRSPILHVQR